MRFLPSGFVLFDFSLQTGFDRVTNVFCFDVPLDYSMLAPAIPTRERFSPVKRLINVAHRSCGAFSVWNKVQEERISPKDLVLADANGIVSIPGALQLASLEALCAQSMHNRVVSRLH